MSSIRYLIIPLLILPIAVPQRSAVAESRNEETAAVQRSFAGMPLVETRRQAISPTPFNRPLDEAKIKKWLELSSQCTIAEFELFLDPMTEQERKLLDKINQLRPPIVNRLQFQHLRSVLKNRGLLSLKLEEQAQGVVRHTTPGVENELFGAFDCVFASVGPLNGSPRYGDVIIRLKDAARENGWATPFSDMHFMWAIRHKPARKMQDLLAGGGTLPTGRTNLMSLGFDDRLHFSHYVVTEKHWHKALAYQAILVLRNLDDSPSSLRVRRRFANMMEAVDAGEFWKLFIQPREQNLSAEQQAARVPFGYLEAKFPDRLDIKFITSIEVPAARLAEARAWPEAKPYLQLIRAKAASVD